MFKAGPFIISYDVKNSSVSHLVTPNKNGKFIGQTLEEAVDIAADIIACSDSFRYPVPPPSPGDAASSQNSGSANENDEARFYCCSFTTKNKRTLESHLKSHKVVKCLKCSQYIKSSTFPFHNKQCNTTPEKISCGVCDFVSIHSSVMWVHRKNHILRPFLCRVGDCRRMFKTAEDLQNHVKFKHEEGFKCDYCDMFFKHKYHKNRHIQRVHLYAKQRCSIGWFRPAGGIVKKKAQGRKMMKCKVEGCSFETRKHKFTSYSKFKTRNFLSVICISCLFEAHLLILINHVPMNLYICPQAFQ